MEIELQEIVEYLSHQVPFSVLDEAALKSLVDEIHISYLRRGQEFPPADTKSENFYLLRSGAIELRDNKGELFEIMNEGESYFEACGSAHATLTGGHAKEDSLLYVITCKDIERLCKRSSKFQQYFVSSLQQRMKLALERRVQSGGMPSVMQLQVSELIHPAPIIVDAETSIKDAAMSMTREQSSSVLVVADNKLVGLVSDQDLRKRCVAAGVETMRPVGEIMSSELVTIPEDASLSDALLTMTRHQIHHLPVMRADIPVGILAVSDLIHHLGANPAFIATDIDKAASVERLVQINRYLPEIQLQLVTANTPALKVGEVISSITDAITCRLLVLAEQRLGPPPVAYAWMAGGSQGRNEQTSHSDQDNALFLSDEFKPEHEEYFSALASFVCDGLNACGYVYCPGNAMASNPQWRQPIKTWRNYFTRWIDEPEKKSLMLSSIFFDLRPVYGDVSLYESVYQEVLNKTQQNAIFIAFMVSNALAHKPPLGFFRNFVLIHGQEHDHTFDVKHRGIVPIVDIARVYALANGILPSNSTERLQLAIDAGKLSHEMGENLIDALEYISSIRNQHQAQQIRQAMAADNYIDPSALSGLERGHLKDAFIIIKEMQEVLASRHQAARIQ